MLNPYAIMLSTIFSIKITKEAYLLYLINIDDKNDFVIQIFAKTLKHQNKNKGLFNI
ncbi:hypothetical protein NIES2100_58980 [Calothrix sp. NIES-2100]|nr:hypothetical protein NIES2100_58980 [Calothrix sp. NIES-2100]